MSNHLPREGREQRLLSRVRAILKGGGRCLLPVVALGRAQVPVPAPPALDASCKLCACIRADPPKYRPLSAGVISRVRFSVGHQPDVQPQELLLILEDHWRRNKDMQGVPIYQASGLATKALSVYQAYIEMMNDDIRTAFDQA